MKNPAFPDFVDSFRNSAPYINAHKGKTFVLLCGGEVVAAKLIEMMQAVRFPNGLNAVGYSEADAEALAERAFPQQRVIQNAPREVTKTTLAELFRGAMRYW